MAKHLTGSGGKRCDVVMGGVSAAWRFVIPAWRRAGPVLAFASLFIGLSLANAGDLKPIWLILGLAGILTTAGRLWPLAMGEPETLKAVNLRVRELRLLAVAGLSFLFLFVLSLLIFVLVLCFAYAAAAAGHGFVASQIATWAPAVDSRGRLVVSVVTILCGLAWAWAALRISLAAPASMAQGKVLVLATWPLTRGLAWKIALANGLTWAAPAGLLALTMLARRANGWLSLVPALVDGVVIAGLWLPLAIGLMGHLYRDLSGAQTGAIAV